MASSKANRKKTATAVELPECPVCLETMSSPIFQCSSGHSLCSSCTHNLSPPICPICRQAMTQMRNWQLEEIILKAKVPCPNKAAGCVYTMAYIGVENHLKECIFREMECPLGAVFGRCSWNGRLREMMDHFKERHPTHCNVTSDADVELERVNINEDERFVYLISQGKFHFIITFKIDTLQKMAYWTIQLIGGKSTAQQYIYEIHVINKQDNRRKVSFFETCFNDTIKADEVFRQNKCALMPLDALKHFISGQTMSFRFFIKKIPQISKDNNANSNNNENKSQNSTSSDRLNFKNPGKNGPGPGPNRGLRAPGAGPKRPNTNASGPKGHMSQNKAHQ